MGEPSSPTRVTLHTRPQRGHACDHAGDYLVTCPPRATCIQVLTVCILVHMNTSTVAEVEAFAARAQATAGPGFIVRPNGYGVRAECVVCHASATTPRANIFVHEHRCAEGRA